MRYEERAVLHTAAVSAFDRLNPLMIDHDTSDFANKALCAEL